MAEIYKACLKFCGFWSNVLDCGQDIFDKRQAEIRIKGRFETNSLIMIEYQTSLKGPNWTIYVLISWHCSSPILQIFPFLYSTSPLPLHSTLFINRPHWFKWGFYIHEIYASCKWPITAANQNIHDNANKITSYKTTFIPKHALMAPSPNMDKRVELKRWSVSSYTWHQGRIWSSIASRIN